MRTCPICFERAEKIYVTPCKHKFCRQCIDIWKDETLSTPPSCPTCRASLVSNSTERVLKQGLYGSSQDLYSIARMIGS